MRGYFSFLALAGGCVLAALMALAAAPAGAGPPRAVPVVTCVVEPVSLSITAQSGPPAARPFTNTVGDSYVQFLAPPLTTTANSAVSLLVNGVFSGTVGGDLSGTLRADTVNGVQVTSPGGFLPNPRGFTISRLALATTQGTITGTLVTIYAATVNVSPYYPRVVNGFLASNDMSGALAGKLLVVPVAGVETLAGGVAMFNGGGLGRLFTGAAPITMNVIGGRPLPSNHSVNLQTGDMISQFRHPLLIRGTTGTGQIEPITALTGTVSGGGLNGAFVAAMNSLLLAGGSGPTPGWQAGDLTFTDGTDVLAGVWLGDLSNTTDLSGFIYQIGGTGIYSDSMLFGNLNGHYYANAIFNGSLSGGYCESAALPTATPPPGATASATAPVTPSATVTRPSGSPTATASPPASTPTLPPVSTATTVPSQTPTTAPTRTPPPPATGTRSPAPTATSPAATGTATAPVPTRTATPCSITFSDVHPTDYFYEPVRYLACNGVISGYADGTFRPYNNTTRGQMVKIVVLGFGLAIQTPAAPTFSDVPPSHPFYPFIETAAANNIVSGYADGTFRPQNNVTRGQLSKIVAAAAGWALLSPADRTFADVLPQTAFYEFVETAACHGILSGYSCGGPGEPCDDQGRPYFRQNNNATRGQIAKIVYLGITAGGVCPQAGRGGP